jgi:hypothetical protein
MGSGVDQLDLLAEHAAADQSGPYADLGGSWSVKAAKMAIEDFATSNLAFAVTPCCSAWTRACSGGKMNLPDAESYSR